MYISKINIEGYKNCKKQTKVRFHKGLNILVGENGSGKTTIINALRMILKENEFSYMNINEDDFYKSFDYAEPCNNIKIDLCLGELSEDEQVNFLTWCDIDYNAILHLEVDKNPNKKGYYKKCIWGGTSRVSAFEEETYDYIDCIYLPPLRDAEEKLTNGRKSRLVKLLEKQYILEDDKNKLVENVKGFNEKIIINKDNEYREIEKAKIDINKTISIAMGEKFGQSINLQFADISFKKILESIKMVFFPNINESDINKFRDIAINSLGYNNLLYIATVFAELLLTDRSDDLFTVLLIEEPEAHLHPQLQVKLIKHLEKLSQENEKIQIIITTHSPVLASSVSIDNLIHIIEDDTTIKATPLNELDLTNSKNYINRWLDITKSTLLFSRGVILVEGISESMLLPELAKICIQKYNKIHKDKLAESLEEAGVSVININGINFKHFMKLFCNVDGSKSEIKIPLKCAGITDKDPAKIIINDKDENNKTVTMKKENYPLKADEVSGENSALTLTKEINTSKFAKLYHSPLKTFEYDLAMKNNTKIMAESIKNIWPKEGTVKNRCDTIIKKDNTYDSIDSMKDDAIFIFNHIDNKEVGKGIFSQDIASRIQEQYYNKMKELNSDSCNRDKILDEIIDIFNVPDYIYNAVVWACGGEVSE